MAADENYKQPNTFREKQMNNVQKSLMRLLALLAAVALVAAACGSDDSGGNAADGGAS